jgi:hypothetical protein
VFPFPLSWVYFYGQKHKIAYLQNFLNERLEPGKIEANMMSRVTLTLTLTYLSESLQEGFPDLRDPIDLYSARTISGLQRDHHALGHLYVHHSSPRRRLCETHQAFVNGTFRLMLLEPFMKHVSNILTGEVTRESGDKDNKRCDGKGYWVELPTSPMTTGEDRGASAFYSMRFVVFLTACDRNFNMAVS